MSLTDQYLIGQKARWPNEPENLYIGPTQFSSPVLLFNPLFSLYSPLSDVVWLHELLQGHVTPERLSVVTSSSSVPLTSVFSLSVFCKSLSASLCPLVGFCFVPSVNKHRHICISGAVFSVDVCNSNSLCGLTCFHQRCWHWFSPLTPTISHPGSMPLYQSDE